MKMLSVSIPVNIKIIVSILITIALRQGWVQGRPESPKAGQSQAKCWEPSDPGGPICTGRPGPADRGYHQALLTFNINEGNS